MKLLKRGAELYGRHPCHCVHTLLYNNVSLRTRNTLVAFTSTAVRRLDGSFAGGGCNLAGCELGFGRLAAVRGGNCGGPRYAIRLLWLCAELAYIY